jgi:hypothetical protein
MTTSPQTSPAARRFFDAVAALGGTLAQGATYRGKNIPVPLICARGHHCAPLPTNVQQRGVICATCTGAASAAAAGAAFWDRVAELGAAPAPGATYTQASTPVPLVCAEGHACSPTPGSVQQGRGICLTCAGTDPAAAQNAFWARVAQAGASPAPGAVYRGAHTPVPLICAVGHHCSPRPNSVQQGAGLCRACACLVPAAAQARFLGRVAAVGTDPSGQRPATQGPVPA